MDAVGIALRHDSSSRIGLGHARRARSLAVAFGKCGLSVVHLVSGAARDGLVAEGIAAETIRCTDGTNLAELAAELRFGAIVFDTLWRGNAESTVREVMSLRRTPLVRVVIDSMPPDHYPIDIPAATPELLVTPYLGAARLRPAAPAERWLAGAAYAVLGPEFERAPVRPAHELGPRVMLSCGGSDEDGLSRAAASALASTGVALDVVIGPLFDARTRTALERLAAEHDAVRLHRAPASLASLIARASLVVGRPGLLRYEAAALGRAAIYLARGREYREYYEGFASAGLAELYFEADRDGRARFLQRLSHIDAEAAPSILAGAAASRHIDVNGAARVVEEILKRTPSAGRCR